MFREALRGVNHENPDPFRRHRPGELGTDEGHTTPDNLLYPAEPSLVSGCLGTEICYFANCVAKNVPPSYVTMQEALEGLKVAWAVVESCNEGKPILL